MRISVHVLPKQAPGSSPANSLFSTPAPALVAPERKFMLIQDEKTTIAKLFIEIDRRYKELYLQQSEFAYFLIKNLQDGDGNDLPTDLELAEIFPDTSTTVIIRVIQASLDRDSSLPVTTTLRPEGLFPLKRRASNHDETSKRTRLDDGSYVFPVSLNPDKPLSSRELSPNRNIENDRYRIEDSQAPPNIGSDGDRDSPELDEILPRKTNQPLDNFMKPVLPSTNSSSFKRPSHPASANRRSSAHSYSTGEPSAGRAGSASARAASRQMSTALLGSRQTSIPKHPVANAPQRMSPSILQNQEEMPSERMLSPDNLVNGNHSPTSPQSASSPIFVAEQVRNIKRPSLRQSITNNGTSTGPSKTRISTPLTSAQNFARLMNRRHQRHENSDLEQSPQPKSAPQLRAQNSSNRSNSSSINNSVHGAAVTPANTAEQRKLRRNEQQRQRRNQARIDKGLPISTRKASASVRKTTANARKPIASAGKISSKEQVRLNAHADSLARRLTPKSLNQTLSDSAKPEASGSRNASAREKTHQDEDQPESDGPEPQSESSVLQGASKESSAIRDSEGVSNKSEEGQSARLESPDWTIPSRMRASVIKSPRAQYTYQSRNPISKGSIAKNDVNNIPALRMRNSTNRMPNHPETLPDESQPMDLAIRTTTALIRPPKKSDAFGKDGPASDASQHTPPTNRKLDYENNHRVSLSPSIEVSIKSTRHQENQDRSAVERGVRLTDTTNGSPDYATATTSQWKAVNSRKIDSPQEATSNTAANEPKGTDVEQHPHLASHKHNGIVPLSTTSDEVSAEADVNDRASTKQRNAETNNTYGSIGSIVKNMGVANKATRATLYPKSAKSGKLPAVAKNTKQTIIDSLKPSLMARDHSPRTSRQGSSDVGDRASIPSEGTSSELETQNRAHMNDAIIAPKRRSTDVSQESDSSSESSDSDEEDHQTRQYPQRRASIAESSSSQKPNQSQGALTIDDDKISMAFETVDMPEDGTTKGATNRMNEPLSHVKHPSLADARMVDRQSHSISDGDNAPMQNSPPTAVVDKVKASSLSSDSSSDSPSEHDSESDDNDEPLPQAKTENNNAVKTGGIGKAGDLFKCMLRSFTALSAPPNWWVPEDEQESTL